MARRNLRLKMGMTKSGLPTVKIDWSALRSMTLLEIEHDLAASAANRLEPSNSPDRRDGKRAPEVVEG